MQRQQIDRGVSCLGALGLAGAMLGFLGCSGDPPEPDTDIQGQTATAADGSSTPISGLPFIDSAGNPKLLGELLARPTALGEVATLITAPTGSKFVKVIRSLDTHIDPLSPIPVRLSKFLTGGGPGLVFKSSGRQLRAHDGPGRRGRTRPGARPRARRQW